MNTTTAHAAVPLHDTPYTVFSTSRGHVMRSENGHELPLRNMYAQEAFKVVSTTGSINLGAILRLDFDERGGAHFTTESGDIVDVRVVAEKVMLQCVTHPDK